MNSQENPNTLLTDIQDSDFGESDVEDLNKNFISNDNKNNAYSSMKQAHENNELTSILNSFTNQYGSNFSNDYDYRLKNGPPPIINLLAENYRIKLTEKISNCNAHQNGRMQQFNNKQVIPILYLTPHIPQNKRHVHFLPDKYDTIPPNATVFDFNAAMIEHNEKITERQELAIAYAEMLCSDISSSIASSSRLSPCFKYSSQRSAAKIAFDRTPQPKSSRPTLPMKQNTKKKIKIYQMKDQNERSNFSDCCRESFYAQQNCSYGQNSFLNDALSIFKVNVTSARPSQLSSSNFQQQQRKQNGKKNPSLSKPQRYRNSIRNNKMGNNGCIERENSSIRTKRSRGPLQIISPNNFESSYHDFSNFENQNKSYNKFNEGFY